LLEPIVTKFQTLLLFVVSLLVSSQVSFAHTHSAHVHGQAELSIAIEHNTVFLSFVAPAESLVGFEHQASSAAEIKKVTLLKQQLANSQSIFKVVDGQCEVNDKHLDMAMIEPSAHAGEHHHNDHAEISVNYQLKCKQIENLSTITLSAFESFEYLKKISAIWVFAHKQGAQVLTSKRNTLVLRDLNETR